MNKVNFFILLLILFVSCTEAQMRDYVGTKDGAVSVGIKEGFGEGGEVKDYFVTRDNLVVARRDTKSEVTKKIGSPDSIQRMLDGNDCWIYEDRKLELFFDGDYLVEWRSFKP